MITFRCIVSLVWLGISLGCANGYVKASEPSIYQKTLTPSPLGKDRIFVVCVLKKDDSETLKEFYSRVKWNEFSERDLAIVEISKNVMAFVVDKDAPGLSFGATEKKMGWNAQPTAQVKSCA